MSELIEIRPLKPVKQQRSTKGSYMFTTGETSSESSEDDDSSADESPPIFKLKTKSSKKSKRNSTIQALPIILNTQPAKKKKKHPQKHIQQFLINTQAPRSPSPTKNEILIKQVLEPQLSPGIQYVPITTEEPSPMTIVERRPPLYPQVYSSPIVEGYSDRLYPVYEPRVRRPVRVYSPHARSVHLPRHTKKLVNRFLHTLEHAHDHLDCNDCDSDHNIDDCRVCCRLRSVMCYEKRRSCSEIDLYCGNRVVLNRQDPHHHRHIHSKSCTACSLLEDSDLVISTRKDHVVSDSKKREKHIHVVESFPSNVKPTVATTTTTTTTTTEPKLALNTSNMVAPSIPLQSSYYPTPYATYVDPNTGLVYMYDPSATAGQQYDYSSYYANPTYSMNNPNYTAYNTNVSTVPAVPNSVLQSQEPIQTTTVVDQTNLMDKGTYTYMPDKRRKHKPTEKTVVIRSSRNPTPPAPNIIIEQPHRSRPPKKIRSTTILKERTTQTPHTTTTTYVRT